MKIWESVRNLSEQATEKGKGITEHALAKTRELVEQFEHNSERRTKASSEEHCVADASKQSEQRKTEKAIEVLSKRDKVGLAAEGAAAAGGVATGVVASGAIAGFAGASTLLGSSTLGSLLGGVFVTATPVGWVVGSAVACGALGYGIAKLIRSGAEQDQVRKELVQSLTARLANMANRSEKEQALIELGQILALLVAAEAISEEDSGKLVSHVEKGSLQPEIALQRIKALAISKGVIEEVPQPNTK